MVQCNPDALLTVAGNRYDDERQRITAPVVEIIGEEEWNNILVSGKVNRKNRARCKVYKYAL